MHWCCRGSQDERELSGQQPEAGAVYETAQLAMWVRMLGNTDIVGRVRATLSGSEARD